MLLMNRVAERCHRDLKYSNAADEDAQSNAAISTAADHDVGEQIYAAAKNTVGGQISTTANTVNVDRSILLRTAANCCEECY